MRTLRYHEQLDVHATIVSLTSANTGVTVRTASGRETMRREAIQPEDAPGGGDREQYEGKQVQGFSQRWRLACRSISQLGGTVMSVH